MFTYVFLCFGSYLETFTCSEIDGPDVFHESCLKEWADVKKTERTTAADAATTALSRQLLSAEREVEECVELQEEAYKEAKQQEFKVDESEILHRQTYSYSDVL